MHWDRCIVSCQVLEVGKDQLSFGLFLVYHSERTEV